MPYVLIRLFNNKRSVLLLNAFLLVLSITALLFLTRDILTVSLSYNKQVAVAKEKAIKTAKPALSDYGLILKNNPFGFPAAELKTLSVSSNTSPSQSELTLIGTVSMHKSRGYAIFMNKTGQQELFRVGEAVYDMGILKRVERDSVFLKKGANEVKMLLSDIVFITEYKKTLDTQPMASGFAKRLSENIYVIDQKRIQQAIENPKEMMTDARLIPNIAVADGRQEGFKLYEVKSGGIYQSLGLQNGDVLLRINGHNISNPESGLQAFTALKGMDKVQLDIIRSGVKMTMTYNIK
ncbi:MAG: type II secretion system protein N [Thermodesulfovibrionales bacterium]|nr:type II secretion system protein N [Thermodesulfovibrionales bacterium]